MSLKTTRRATTARTFAGTVLTVALLVPAATACSSTSGASNAASPAATAATAGTPGTSAPAAPSSPAATAPASGAPTTPAAPPAKPGNGTTAAKPGTGATTTPAPPGKPAPGARTQTLPDGSTAEIREVAPQHFVAKIVNNGDVLATLDAKDTDAGLDANDMFIVLSLDGTVHAWMGGGHQGPGTFKVAGDWTVKVTKSGELKYRADILGLDNAVNGTLETNGHDVGVSANGVYIVLSTGGRISAHA